MTAERAVEMAGYGRGGKPKAGFPPRPQPLEIDEARFPHSRRPDDDASGKVEIQRQDSHFPTGSVLLQGNQKNKPRKEAWHRSLRARLQAHSSMRIC